MPLWLQNSFFSQSYANLPKTSPKKRNWWKMRFFATRWLSPKINADTRGKKLSVIFFFFWAAFVTNHKKKTRHLSHKLHELKYPWDKENCLNNVYFAGDQSLLYVQPPPLFLIWLLKKWPLYIQNTVSLQFKVWVVSWNRSWTTLICLCEVPQTNFFCLCSYNFYDSMGIDDVCFLSFCNNTVIKK